MCFDCLCNSLKCVRTCLRAVVPHHQFIIDSHTVRIFFSKCHIQLRIKNSGRNLYSYTLLFNQSLSKYSFSSSGIRSLPSSHKQEKLPNRQLWTCFHYDICQETEVYVNLSYRVWTVSCTTCCCANLFEHVWGPLHIASLLV